MINELVLQNYGLTVDSIEKSSVGAGSDTYFITCGTQKYVLKFPCESEMNHPNSEPFLCEYLLKRGLSVCEFIRNNSNSFISKDENGRKFHLQKYVQGKVYGLNEAPAWLLKESAQTLGKIHTVLTDYRGLPDGIGKDFFKYKTPKNSIRSYTSTLETAKQQGDTAIEDDLLYRIDLLKKFPEFEFDLSKLSCKSTHGDYSICQLICGESQIKAVIDWTSACVHPIVWEIIRSFAYAAPSSKDGKIDISEFLEYVSHYLNFGKLNSYDVAMMPKLFYYQLAVCDYYRQYYESTADNRDIYLHQAVFSTKLMKWFEKNIDYLTQCLMETFGKL